MERIFINPKELIMKENEIFNELIQRMDTAVAASTSILEFVEWHGGSNRLPSSTAIELHEVWLKICQLLESKLAN